VLSDAIRKLVADAVASGLTDEQVEARTGVDKAIVNRFRHGKRDVRLSTADKLLALLADPRIRAEFERGLIDLAGQGKLTAGRAGKRRRPAAGKREPKGGG